jgi:hypothetical protein
MRVITAALTASLILPFSTISAQRAPPIEVGALVRVTAPDCVLTNEVAKFMSVHRDTLTVRTDSVLTLSLATVRKLEVIKGRNNLPVYVGMVTGALGGAVIGVLTASGEHQPREPLDFGIHLDDPEVAAVVGALLGGFVGGVVGTFFRTERWEEVALDRVRVSLTPQWEGRFAVGMTLRF